MKKSVFILRSILTISLGIILVFFLAQDILAVSKAGVLFLTLPAGARAAGMGESFIALSDDATATHWNPAGLGTYPLTEEWFEYVIPEEFKIKKIALLKNELPERNFKGYDIWAISFSDLLLWNGKKWVNYKTYPTTPGESVESIVIKLTQEKDEEKKKKMTYKVATENNFIDKDSLEKIRTKIKELLPPDYQATSFLDSLFEKVLESWEKCLLNQQILAQLDHKVKDFLADTNLSSKELDEISMLLETSTQKFLAEKVKIPFRLALSESLTTIISSSKELWIGTKSGLFRYDRMVWKRYGSSDGLLDENITSLTRTHRGTIWAGTSSGLAKFDGKKWTFYSVGLNLPDNFVTQIVVEKEAKLWVATKRGLARFENGKWEPFFMYTVKSGDDLDKIVKRFIGSENQNRIEKVKKAVLKTNALKDKDLSLGQNLKLPYHLGINSEITALSLDKSGTLWVGTLMGIKAFADGRWINFGYKLYTAKEKEKVVDVAQKFLHTKDPKRVQMLVKRITEYNNLKTEDLEPEEKIYVYHNATGSKILSICPFGKSGIYVGTQFGTLKFDGSSWNRYHHIGLGKAKTYDIKEMDGELWFVTEDKVVIYAHAKREMTFMHTNLLPEFGLDLYYEYLSYVQHFEGWGSFGGNITFLSYGEMQRTSEIGEPLGTFQSYETALTLSYGTKLTTELSGGLNAKIIHSHLAAEGYRSGEGPSEGKGTGISLALDAGILYQTPIKRLRLGVALTNVGPDISYSDYAQGDPLPTNLGTGLGYRLFDTPYNRLTLLGEVNYEMVENEAILNAGMEYWYANFFALRAGYLYDKAGVREAFTLGAGLQYNVFRFDFAYIPSSRDDILTNTMRFSLTGRF